MKTSDLRLNPPATATDPALTIYYDGACPVCRREIAHYRGLPGAEVCAWVDASQCSVEALGRGLARDAAMRRFHVRLADGQLLQGAPGFAALWRVLPGWQWLGRLAQTWPLRPALAVGYSLFLKVRPLWRAAPPPVLKASDLPASVPADPRSDQAAAHNAFAEELARFNRLAATWWDARGPMRPLHVLNGLRASHVQALAQAHHHLLPEQGLTGLRLLDLGCGAGLLSEPMARAGAAVTGVDAAERSIAVARQHAAKAGLQVDYRCGEAQHVLAAGELFDVVLLLEVVEHVQDMPAFVAKAAAHLAPGGLLVASTINRTGRSFALAIVGAEWVMRVLPRGTHRWAQFVTPGELDAAMAAAGLAQQSITGMRYLPVLHRASWCRSTAVNYLASYAENPAKPAKLVGL